VELFRQALARCRSGLPIRSLLRGESAWRREFVRRYAGQSLSLDRWLGLVARLSWVLRGAKYMMT
jgi:hypothetical protein